MVCGQVNQKIIFKANEMLSRILKELKKVQDLADQVFARVASEHPEAVACKQGCDDCCHAMFDISPVEALGLAAAFVSLPRSYRRELLRRGEKAAKIFDEASVWAMGLPEDERNQHFSNTRVPCPLLDAGKCALYEARPITCRLYGIPVEAGGRARTCPKARFEVGGTYPTVHYDKLIGQLNLLSGKALQDLAIIGPERRDVYRALTMAQEHGDKIKKALG